MLLKQHIRLARAYLQISLKELAEFSNVPYETLKKLEKGYGLVTCSVPIMMEIKKSLETRGIIFIEGDFPTIKYDPSKDVIGFLKEKI